MSVVSTHSTWRQVGSTHKALVAQDEKIISHNEKQRLALEKQDQARERVADLADQLSGLEEGDTVRRLRLTGQLEKATERLEAATQAFVAQSERGKELALSGSGKISILLPPNSFET